MKLDRSYILPLLFGGSATTLFVAGYPVWSGLCAVALIMVTVLDFSPIYHRTRASSWAGLVQVIPIQSLDRGFSLPRTTANKRSQVAINALCSAMEETRKVDMLLCSGYRMIGNKRHPGFLHDTLAGLPVGAEVRVLLLDPSSDAGRDRAKKVMRGRAGRYKPGLESVLYTLSRLRYDHDLDIEVRLYSEDPIWQMIILPTEIWGLVAAGGRSTDSSPMFVLARSGKYNLSYGYEAVWERRWNIGAPVDLSSIPMPDWDSLTHM